MYSQLEITGCVPNVFGLTWPSDFCFLRFLTPVQKNYDPLPADLDEILAGMLELEVHLHCDSLSSACIKPPSLIIAWRYARTLI